MTDTANHIYTGAAEITAFIRGNSEPVFRHTIKDGVTDGQVNNLHEILDKIDGVLVLSVEGVRAKTWRVKVTLVEIFE